MGNSNRKSIKTFNNIVSYKELQKMIIDTEVNKDSDFMIFIDCTISNVYHDGTTKHDFSKNYDKYNRYSISNPYLTLLNILKKFPHINNKYHLYFFGTENSNSKSNKLEKIQNNFDSFINEERKIKLEYFNDIDELIYGYMYGICSLKEINGFNKGIPFNNIFDEVVNNVKKNNKFTIVIIIFNGTNKKYKKNNILNIFKKISKMSKYPLEIIAIGIGNNDIFKYFEGFDILDHKKIGISKKKLRLITKNRLYDNFHMVVLNKIIKRTLLNNSIKSEIYKNIFSELPYVYKYIQRSNVLSYIPNHLSST